MAGPETHHDRDHGRHRALELEYVQANENLRQLVTLRTRLLILGAPLVGVAALLLGDRSLASPDGAALWLVALISLFGFFATLGAAAQARRGAQIQGALVRRLAHLEGLFRSSPSPDAPDPGGGMGGAGWGGQFREVPRPGSPVWGLIPAGRDSLPALVIGAALGAWGFPFATSVLRLLSVELRWAVPFAAAAAITVAVRGTRELLAGPPPVDRS